MSKNTQTAEKTGLTAFATVFVVISLVYLLSLAALWPGLLGHDSLAVLLEVKMDGKFHSGKTTFWFYFVKLLYEPTQRVEVPIIVQMLLSSLMLARVVAWCWNKGMRKTALFSLFFISLAPHVVTNAMSLYSDGLFSAAVVALCFELWLIARRGRISPASFWMLALIFPCAAFSRANGGIFILSTLCVAVVLGGWDKLKVLFVVAAWSGLVFAGGQLHDTPKHGALYPLALFETVNFLQPRAMGLRAPEARVSEKTVEILTRHQPIKTIVANYDRDYWDPLVYKADGPLLASLTPEEKDEFVKEFFSYNVWKNIPAFLGSRVNVFLVTLLAQGGIADLDYSAYVIAYVQSKSEFRKFHLTRAEAFFKHIYHASERHRWLLWTPLLGFFLIFYLLRLGVKHRNFPVLLVALPMALQVIAIFFLSIAGEYRYLLPLFMLPVAFLPILATLRRQHPSEDVFQRPERG